MSPRINMADFGMHESVNRHAVHQHSTAYPRADGDIHQIPELSRRSPTMFGQSRGVGVRVEADGA